MPRHEYRVAWRRAERDDPNWNGDPEGGVIHASSHTKIYQSSVRARRFLARLTNDWAALGIDPDKPMCCTGWGCDCQGRTHRDQAAEDLKRFGAIEWARVERRTVGDWESSE